MKRKPREMWEVNKYLWLCLLFVALFIPWADRQGVLSISMPAAFGVLALAILNGAVRTYCGWRRGGFNDDKGWSFNLVDIALISAAVRLTGGIDSEIWLAYFVLTIAETLFSTSRQTILLHVCLILAYLAATWPDHLTQGYLFTVTTRMFFLVVVGSFGLRLSTDRERRNRELALLNEQVAASEERARIAREVHDSLGHALVASILRLELCLRLFRRAPDEAEKLLQEEVPALRAAWNEGRNLAFHLRPWEKDGAGLAENLRRHVSRFAERTGLPVDLAIADGEWDIPADAEMALTRILQEALTNVARHAQASQVSIRVDRVDHQISCRICDDGVGFDATAAGGSFGLNAMRERAEKLGGRFAVTSRPGEGTTIESTLPVR